MATTAIDAVVFDIGGVLVDWDPRHLYEDLIEDPAEREWFVTSVVSRDWNHAMDAGRALDESIALLVDAHPEYATLIEAWRDRWPEMLGDEIPGTRFIVEDLHANGVPLYALTNWSADTWPHGAARLPFLDRLFDGIVVSGREGVAKPDRRIFEILIDRYDLSPGSTVFIDDLAANTGAAAALGFTTHTFSSARVLRAWLEGLGLLGVRRSPA